MHNPVGGALSNQLKALRAKKLKFPRKEKNDGLPSVAQGDGRPLGSAEMQVPFLPPPHSGLRIHHCHRCGLGSKYSLDLIPDQEPIYAAKKKERKKKKRILPETCNINFCLSFQHALICQTCQPSIM